MRVLVCCKHVPDVLSARRIETGALVRGEDDTLNELDENAIEAGVQLVEEFGGEAIVVIMGPEEAEDSALAALQKGADSAIVISDERLAGSDVVATAKVLAGATRKLSADAPIDLVITGMASLDAMTSMLPAALAATLDWPYLGLAKELEVGDSQARISRCVDGYDEELSASLPAVVSVTDQANEPRYPNFKAMKAARSKPLEAWSLDDLEGLVDFERVGTAGAGQQVIAATATAERSAGTIVQDSGQGGEALAEYLRKVVK